MVPAHISRAAWRRTMSGGRGVKLVTKMAALHVDQTARVIFCIVAGQMILWHGFIKKTPQTPKRDLDIARVRKAETEQSGAEEAQP